MKQHAGLSAYANMRTNCEKQVAPWNKKRYSTGFYTGTFYNPFLENREITLHFIRMNIYTIVIPLHLFTCYKLFENMITEDLA